MACVVRASTRSYTQMLHVALKLKHMAMVQKRLGICEIEPSTFTNKTHAVLFSSRVLDPGCSRTNVESTLLPARRPFEEV